MEVGVALRRSRVIADIGLDSIRLCCPVVLTVLGSLNIDLILGRGGPPLLASSLRDMPIATTHAVRSSLTLR